MKKNFPFALRRMICGIGVLFSVAACQFSSSTEKISASSRGGESKRIVHLAIWSNYLSPEVLSRFESQSGVKVQVSNYSSNEELLAKLQAGASGYDVVVPSDYMVEVMIHLGLLQELDLGQLSFFRSVDSRFKNQAFDRENRFSVPYDWGTTGIGINRTLYSGKLTSWRDFFREESLHGKVSLLDDSREVLGAALKALGYRLNSENSEELKQAKELVLQMRKRVKAFTSEPMMSLVHGEVAVAQIYMSDALQARKMTEGKIDYVVPTDGTSLWMDNLVIPKGSKNRQDAHLLINFLLEPQTSLSTVTQLFLAPTNRDTYVLLPKEVQKNVMLFPPASILSKSEMLHDLGSALKVWDRMWTEIKAH